MDRGYPLIVLSCPPYAGSAARNALDLALAFAVFNQQPRLLFTGDGLRQLVDGQEAAAIGRKSLRKVIDSFPLYDIEAIYVGEDELTAQGIDSGALPDTVCLLDAQKLQALYDAAGHLLSL